MSSNSPVSPIRQRHLWEQIADELRASILSGQLSSGTRLITADLAEKWGVSRGPVREALMALENEGIVVSTRRQGTVVGTSSLVDLEEVLDVREAIELAAAIRVCSLGDEVTQSELRRLADMLKRIDVEHEKGQGDLAGSLDLAFHQAIVDLAGNSRFSGIYRQMLSQNRHHVRAIDPEVWPLAGWSHTRDLHFAIFDAIVACDIDRIREAIQIHYAFARRVRLDGPKTQAKQSSMSPLRAKNG